MDSIDNMLPIDETKGWRQGQMGKLCQIEALIDLSKMQPWTL